MKGGRGPAIFIGHITKARPKMERRDWSGHKKGKEEVCSGAAHYGPYTTGRRRRRDTEEGGRGKEKSGAKKYRGVFRGGKVAAVSLAPI